MTPEEARTAWVEALRSGDYEQGKSNLCYRYTKHDEYCCLGVACELAIADGVPIKRETPTYQSYSGPVAYDQQLSALPEPVKYWLGLYSDLGHRKDTREKGTGLASMNDNGSTFAQIADAIESTPEAFFDIEATD